MPTTRFDIAAQSDPQTLIRLLNYFAQLGLLPSRVRAVEADGVVTARIEQPDLSERQARIIAEKMRCSVLVHSVAVRCGRHILKPLDGTIDGLSA